MIRVIKDWGIDADKYGYQVGKTKLDKHGKEQFNAMKYPPSVSKGLEIILAYENRSLITRDGISLDEYITKLDEIAKNFAVDVLSKVEKIERMCDEKNKKLIAEIERLKRRNYEKNIF